MKKYNLGSKSKPTKRQKIIGSVMKDFFARYKDNSDCIGAIVRFHNLNRGLGLLRCACGNDDLPAFVRSRSVICSSCRKIWWITARTAFKNARDLRPYLAAIRLMEKRINVKPKDLVELFGIALSTAFVVIKKVEVVIAGYMKEGFLVASSRAFLSTIGKRSVATEKFSYPISEENAFDGQRVLAPTARDPAARTQQVQAILEDLSPQATTIYDALGTTEIHFETLARSTNLPISIINSQITLLELEGLIEYAHGDHIRRKAQLSDAIADEKQHPGAVGSVVALIRDHHHRISRKYIQLYAAFNWCINDGDRWGEDALLKAFLGSKATPWKKLRAYVSAASIKLLPDSEFSS
ncbi:MAG: hypothetical protein K2X93_27150 [Candidatus Obscuribacterales bacterium]|nr:hypothetical protein [Candidatus Obscuribacterales bacterium]